MENKAFDIVAQILQEALSKEGFKVLNRDEFSLDMAKGDALYKMEFSPMDKKFELFSGQNGDGDSSYSSLAEWLFDAEKDGEKEAKSIGNDFAETVTEAKKAPAKTIRTRAKADENDMGATFLVNRLVNIFPETRDELKRVKESCTNFPHVAFVRATLLPKISLAASTGTPKETFKKLTNTLSHLYANGDLDARALVTIVILSGVDDETAKIRLQKALSDELRTAWAAAETLKGKKIRPEKLKKRKSFMARALEESAKK